MKKNIILTGIVVLLVAVIVALVALFFMTVNFESHESHMKAAVSSFNNGKYEDAISEFDQAIEIKGEYYQLYLAKANVEIAAGKEDSAVESVIKMIDLLKIDEKEFKEEDKILERMHKKSAYPVKDDMLFWFYNKEYSNQKYSEYILWVEENLPYSYVEAIEKVRKK